MAKRKNRPDKYGVGKLDKKEVELLKRFQPEDEGTEATLALVRPTTDDVVFEFASIAGAGWLIRGLRTKGYLKEEEVTRKLPMDEGEKSYPGFRLSSKGVEKLRVIV